MAKTSRPSPRRKVVRRRLLIVGLALFLVVDAGLVWFALSHTRTPQSAAPLVTFPDDEAPGPSATPQTPIPTQDVPPSPDQDASLTPPTRLLAARDGTVAWRATTGPCPATTARPERSVDGGATWKTTDATATAGVVALQRLVPESRDVLSAVGADRADCSVMLVRTFVAGDNYRSYPAELPASWFLERATPNVVHTPLGDRAAPCPEVVAMDARGTRAAVLCASGEGFLSSDSAASWSPPVRVPGAVNVALSGRGFWLASVGADGCAGVRLTESGAAAGAAPGCFPSAVPASALAGQIALSEADGMLWVWAGDDIRRSNNGGLVWQ